MIGKEIEEKILKILIMKLGLEYTETSKIVLCQKCKGTGFYTTSELVDYHRGDYETNEHQCNSCVGDGRMIRITTTLDFRKHEEIKLFPYVGNENKAKHKEYHNFSIKIDNRMRGYESKYPELEALTYDNYDAMLRQILIEEALVEKDDK